LAWNAALREPGAYPALLESAF